MHFSLGFLLFFLLTSFLFWLFEHDHPAQKDLLQTPLDVLYWWLITCTTVGYGDITPKTPEGKVLVIIVIVVGVAMVTTGVARLGGFFFARRLQSMRGLGRMNHLSDHVVVCGWHDDLAGILQALLDAASMDPSQVVLVTDVDPDKVNTLRSRREFRGLELVSGDFTTQADLGRAGVVRARSVMIIAAQGEPAPDARTLLGVMAVRQLNKTAHLCAEVEEERFVPYILEAGCDEIIHLASLRKGLAAQILVSPGMGNIVYDLLDFDQGAFIGLEEIPESCQGKPFSTLKHTYEERPEAFLLGLLENVGNPYEMKREAMRNAQKTPDISQLVSQLQAVKQKTSNTPLLCPPPDHIIQPRTCAVVLQRARQEDTA